MPRLTSSSGPSSVPASCFGSRFRPALPGFGALLALTGAAHAQTLGPDFVGLYTITDLGSAPVVPISYGALTFKQGDPSVLLLSGNANTPNAKLYALTVKRAVNGDVIGFDCAEPEVFASVPGVTGGIDGGIDYGPGGVIFYTTYSDNMLGQIKPGSTAPDLLTSLSPLGIAASTGTLRFVPPGFAGAGSLKIVSYNTGFWYDASITPNGNGTYDIAVDPNFVQVNGGPEGVVYIEGGNPGFPVDSVLVSLYASGQIHAFEIDADGDPIASTQRTFITGLNGAEGAAIDPVTGDFFFSTFGASNRVIRVAGFTTTKTCLGDINLDGNVDGNDLAIVLGAWGGTDGGVGELTGNCLIDGDDLALLLGQWGPCGD